MAGEKLEPEQEAAILIDLTGSRQSLGLPRWPVVGLLASAGDVGDMGRSLGQKDPADGGLVALSILA